MARLREADLRVGDRLRYTLGAGPSATHIPGRIDGIERAPGSPTMALLTREDTGDQLIVRLGHLARHAKRMPVLCPSATPTG